MAEDLRLSPERGHELCDSVHVDLDVDLARRGVGVELDVTSCLERICDGVPDKVKVSLDLSWSDSMYHYILSASMLLISI